jgi:glucan phosphorylase
LIQKGDWCGSEFIHHRRNENRRRVRGSETESRGSTESVSGHEEIGRAIERGQLNGGDPFLVLADYAAYIACQEQVSEAWADEERWTRLSILNTTRSGKFSSDRAIREYCDGIWGVEPVPVNFNAG